MPITTIDFSFDGAQETVEGDEILLRGPLFRCGDYPDKQFRLTPDEMHRAIGRFFDPVPMDLEHKPSEFSGVDLSGVFGSVRRVWTRPGDDWLHAEISKPKALHEVMPERRVSASFNSETKDLVGAAWTASPRVQGAEVFAAFSASPGFVEKVAAFAMSRHNTPEGQTVMQGLHDMSARAGAVCDRKNVEMASQHEATGIQKIHDETVKHGASCASGEAPPWVKSNYSRDSRGENTMPEQTDQKQNEPKWYERLIPAFLKAGVSETDAHAAFSAIRLPPADPAQSAAFAEQEKRIAALLAKDIRREAEIFADGEIRAHRAFSAERPNLVSAFTRAAEDDSAAPREVTFSAVRDGKAVEDKGSRVDALKAEHARRPAHSFTQEFLATNATFNAESGKYELPLTAKFSRTETDMPTRGDREDDPSGDAPMSAQEREALLSKTATGRALLSQEKSRN